MGLLTAPKVTLTWAATSLTTAFEAYRVWRRPARLPVRQWELIAEIDVPNGYTAADVEAQHTSFVDYDAGWVAPGTDEGQWDDGWDYAISVVDGVRNIESPVTTVSRVTVTGDNHPWLVSNVAPWLNVPVERMPKAEGTDDDPTRVYQAAGRDEVLTRTAIELPSRRYELGWDAIQMVGEDQLRLWRAAAASGLTFSLLLPLGDRIIGSPSPFSRVGNTEELQIAAEMRLVETTRQSPPAWYNRPCGLVLNGTTQYVEHGDVTVLDATAPAFTAFSYGAFAPVTGNENVLAKSSGSGQGWRLYGTVFTTMAYELLHSSGSVTITSTDARWQDGTARLATGVHTSASQTLYLDDTVAVTSTSAVGTINNAHPVRVGALSSAVTEAMAGTFHAWGVYNRALTAAEVGDLWHYLAGHAGYRPPAGADLFVDLRDDRSWPGVGAVVHDLSGNGLYGTAVASPVTKGRPVALRILEDF